MRANETWAMDFVHDQLATGRKLRVLTIVDTFSRFSPAIEPRFNFRGADVVEVLERVGRQVRIPEGDPGRPGHRVRRRAIWISGRISAMSRSTSHGQASQPTMPSSNPSTASSERNA